MELNKNLQNALNTYADNIAIEVENHSLTYTELKNQSLRLLAFLKADKMGGGKYSSLIVFGSRELEVYVSILACVLGAITFIPLNPKFPKERQKNIIERTDNAPMILCPNCLESFRKIAHSLSNLLIFSFGDTQSLQKEFPKHQFVAIPNLQQEIDTNYQESEIQDSSPAYLLFTSGSTGIPKGVLVSRANLANYCQRVQSLYHFSPRIESHNFLI